MSKNRISLTLSQRPQTLSVRTPNGKRVDAAGVKQAVKSKLKRSGPKYLVVLKELKGRLERGEYRSGSLMPREDELCRQFEVGRYTLREALQVLEDQGFIERKRRAGTRVLPGASQKVFRHPIDTPGDVVDFIRGTTRDFTPPRLVRADGKLARLLGCDEKREWIRVEGLRVDAVDQRPVGLSQIYVDPTRASLPLDSNFGDLPVFLWLRNKYGIRTTVISQDITAVQLSAAEAKALSERAGSPALRFVRRYFDDQQKIFEITVTVHRSADFVSNTHIRIEQS